MAKIAMEGISEISNANDLIDYLALNIYNEENYGIREAKNIPEYIKNVINIIDFETEYEMEGITFTSLDNYSIYNKIIYSFEQTGNNEIAKYIKENIELKKHEYNDDDTELDKKIRSIISEKAFWENVMKYVEKNINKDNGVRAHCT
jgi:hypothetical protein